MRWALFVQGYNLTIQHVKCRVLPRDWVNVLVGCRKPGVCVFCGGRVTFPSVVFVVVCVCFPKVPSLIGALAPPPPSSVTAAGATRIKTAA